MLINALLRVDVLIDTPMSNMCILCRVLLRVGCCCYQDLSCIMYDVCVPYDIYIYGCTGDNV